MPGIAALEAPNRGLRLERGAAAGACFLLDLPPGVLWGEQRPAMEKVWG